MNKALSALDMIVESAAVQGQLDAGVAPKVVAARSSLGERAVCVFSSGRPKKIESPKWSQAEDELLESCLGILAERDIAELLGRSPLAVRLRWKRDLALPAPSKHPDYITANQIANGIGSDVHAVMALIDRGILKGHTLPMVRTIRLVHRTTLLCFLTNPMNWAYFHPERVGLAPPDRRRGKNYDVAFWAHARRLVLKRKALWKDAWWRIGEVARFRGVSTVAINKAIRESKLPATAWGNWWVLRSHAMDSSIRLQAWSGVGGKGQYHSDISKGAEGFIVLACAVGLMYAEAGELMGWKKKRVDYFFHHFRRSGMIPHIIDEHGLFVHYDETTGGVFASWKVYADRFPRLARLMKAAETILPTGQLSKYVKRVKCKEATWQNYAVERPVQASSCRIGEL